MGVIGGMTMPKMAFNEVSTPFWVLGLAVFGGLAAWRRLRVGRPASRAVGQTDAISLTLTGFSILSFFVLQVGVGRRWGISTALADYYAMFPLAGCWLLTAGWVAWRGTDAGHVMWQGADKAGGGAIVGIAWRGGLAMRGTVLMMLGAVFAVSLVKYWPTTSSIERVMAQKTLVHDLGLAACSEAIAAGAGARLLFKERFPAGRCKACRDVLDIPEGVFEGGIFAVVAKESAHRVCPDVAGRLVLHGANPSVETSGDTDETNRFYRQYYE